MTDEEDRDVPVHVRPAELSPGISFTDWKSRIQMAADLDQLSEIVRKYLAAWRPDQLRVLPLDVAVMALASTGDIATRAVAATQAELKCDGDDRGARLLQEMALTLRAAASRYRFLTMLRSREGAGRDGVAGSPAIMIDEEEIAAYRARYPRLTRTEVLWAVARSGPARADIERSLAEAARRKR